MAEVNLIGKTILGYLVNEQLGQGAFGTVYKVSKTNASGHYVRALKHISLPTAKQYNAVLNSMGGGYSKADDYFAKVLQDIVNEIKILNSLAEKGADNIVRYFENEIIESQSPKRYDVYILMEYLTPFSEYMETEKLTINNVINLGKDLLSALKICHECGIIHRDIKDDNIFVTKDRRFKLGDFGVSKVLKDKSKAESMKGTPNFIAPEVYMGKEGYTSSVDLYSLGIVLYRLLNYARNPFLPPFPNTYDTTDEDKAFEERMKGSVPPLPVLGGEELGEIIVKAISNQEARYVKAEEFYDNLLRVSNSLSEAILNEKVNMTINPINTRIDNFSAGKKQDETIGENDFSNLTLDHKDEDACREQINKHVFDQTMGESVNSGKPQNELPLQDVLQNTTPLQDTVQETSNVGKGDNKPVKRREVKAIEKRNLTPLIYALPVIIAVIGLIIYSFIIPNVYGKTVSLIEWLFTDSNNIISTLGDPNKVLPNVYHVLFLKVVMFLISASFITSLFFVGKKLHQKKEPDNENVIFKGKEAYYYIMKISAALREAKRELEDPFLEKIGRKLKILEEKLKYESDFGFSKKAMDCENEIAQSLNDIYCRIKTLDTSGDLNENLNKANKLLQNVENLLRQRKEIMKR